ncbi:DUF418 domain-containing protein [Cohnella soli]|uniref:DUF418 domain-containing protein n=1 Tax=Cohnella soli TaxID=425005 RepID=A0ABW0HVA5_9BACL
MNPSSKARITALDLARALAIFGMIIVNYKPAMKADNDGPAWLRAIAGVFEGRASALFVVLAGVGVSLMTSKARRTMDSSLIRQSRNSLFRRAAFLLAAGTFLLLIGWSADILHYYAVFLFVAAFLFTASDRILLVLIPIVLLVSQMLLLVLDYSAGWNAEFHEYSGFWTLDGFVRNLLFNGFHPVFPWLCFFLVGMWIGRRDWLNRENRARLLSFSLLGVVALETVSYLLIRWTSPWLDHESATYLFGTKPMPPTALYILSGTCSSLGIIAICLYAIDKFEPSRLTQAVISTGQLSLSHYIGHVVIGLGVLEVFGYLENGNLAFALAYATAYFIFAILFSTVWRRRMDRGPVELLMRKLS